jgi:hypothetical protein
MHAATVFCMACRMDAHMGLLVGFRNTQTDEYLFVCPPGQSFFHGEAGGTGLYCRYKNFGGGEEFVLLPSGHLQASRSRVYASVGPCKEEKKGKDSAVRVRNLAVKMEESFAKAARLLLVEAPLPLEMLREKIPRGIIKLGFALEPASGLFAVMVFECKALLALDPAHPDQADVFVKVCLREGSSKAPRDIKRSETIRGSTSPQVNTKLSFAVPVDDEVPVAVDVQVWHTYAHECLHSYVDSIIHAYVYIFNQ